MVFARPALLGLAVALGPALLQRASACSNILVTPGASADGSALVGDNDDSVRRHGLVTHFPAEDHQPGDTREVCSDTLPARLLASVTIFTTRPAADMGL